MTTPKSIKALFPKEEDLCRLFAREMEELGWVVYPETGGFDLLLVWPSTGHQLGVEAKLMLNAKVAEQIVPDDISTHSSAQHVGPDFRAVIVPALTASSLGIAKLLKILGVNVWDVRDQGRGPSFFGAVTSYEGQSQWEVSQHRMPGFDCAWFDFNPVARCPLPHIMPAVPAGVPSPVRLTPWKMGALKTLVDLELDGFVTAKSVRAHGIDPRRFCATDGWLKALGEGRWGKGNVPDFAAQHPQAYAQLLEEGRLTRLGR